jgi:hypothetical protein
MDSWSKFLVISFFLFLLLSVSFSQVCAVDEDEAAQGLADAEAALVSTYGTVLEAEETGANVSSLLDKLNVGGEYLAAAYNWYRLGVFENASAYANLCRGVVSGVSSEAVELKDKAEVLMREGFLVTVFGSAVGAGIILVVGFVVWRVFRRRYFRRTLELKPEVVSDES